jgi:transcriptional regulator with XRE-family HTH domain
MDELVHQRIKKLREKLGLNQRDFSKLLSLSPGYIGGIEAKCRRVNDRIIKLIISEFGVKEDWLRYGKGTMFAEKRANEKSIRILALFNDLPPHLQDVILGTIELLRKAHEIDRSHKTSQ